MEGAHLDAGMRELAPVAPRRAERAEGVVQHAYRDPRPGPLRERLREAAPGAVVPDDVVLEVHPALRTGDQREHRLEGAGAVGVMLEPVAADGPGTRRPVDRAGELVTLGGEDAAGREPRGDAHPTGAPDAPSPSAPSTGRSAWITKAMWSSSGTPSSSAPWRTSSRFTPRANALSLSFFFTDATSRSAKLRDGRTSAQATRKPHSSSTANRALASGVSRGTPV